MRFRWILTLLASLVATISYGQPKGMALIEGGTFTPLYMSDTVPLKIDSYWLDVYPVTNAEFKNFIVEHPKWQKEHILQLYADGHYLEQFDENLELDEKYKPNSPVTNISWFAARAYCENEGKRLPTVDEWEYAAQADQTSKNATKNPGYTSFILGWYEKPNSYGREVGSTFKNYWGVYDMHGLVWEWTYDYNSILISGESRKDLQENANLYCGGASVNATDLTNYAAFMRYAFRGSVKSNYSVRNLGFRCAQTIQKIDL